MKLLLFFSLSIFSFGKIATAQDSVLVKADLSMPTNKIGKYKDLTLQLKLTAVVSKRKIRFRDCLRYNCAEHSIYKNPDAFIELEKLKNGVYTIDTLKSEAAFHPMPCLDSAGNELYRILSVESPLTYESNISPYFRFTKGEYRIRMQLHVPKIAKYREHIIYTEWFYFSFVNDEVDYSDFGQQINKRARSPGSLR